MAAVPVLSEFQWARIVAKAYLDGTTGALERDPKAVVDAVRTSNDPPGINPPAIVRLMSLDYTHYVGGPDGAAKNLLAILQGSALPDLQGLIDTGNFRAQPAELYPGEWIDPSGAALRLFLHSTVVISLKDWIRIYAFLWHQIRSGNPTIREHFEEDPARTLQDPNHVFNDEIIANLNGGALPPISYTYQTTPLFTLGNPPPPGNLSDIRSNLGAMGYRHRIRMSC